MASIAMFALCSLYRNREAFQIFQEHSTRLRKERVQEQAKHRTTIRGRSRKTGKDQAASHTIKASPRDLLLDDKRPRLVELLHETRAERHEVRKQAQAVQASIEQQVQTQCAE